MKWGSETAVRELSVENWAEIRAASEYYAKQPYAVPTLIQFTEDLIKTYRDLLSRDDVPKITSELKILAEERLKNGLNAFMSDDLRLVSVEKSFIDASLDALSNFAESYTTRKKTALKRITKLLGKQENIKKALALVVGNGLKNDIITEWSKELKVKEEFLQMFVVMLASVIILAAKKSFGEIIVKVDENRTVCPFCGSNPMIGRVNKDDSGLFLICSVCGTEWRYPRIRCTSCGNTDFNSLEMLYVGGDNSPHRIHVCKKCNHYIKIVDEKTKDEPFATFPSLLDAATVYLDIIAKKRGLNRRGGLLSGKTQKNKRR